MDSFTLLLVAGILVLAVIFVRLLLYLWERLNPRSAWPTTNGHITHAVIERWLGDNSGAYRAHIAYEFSVGHFIYRGERLRWDQPVLNGTKAEMQRVLRRYPVGRRVMVHYNPKDPHECCLEI